MFKNLTQKLALAAFTLYIVTWGSPAPAAPTNAPIIGEIEQLILDDPANIYSGGKIVVGGVSVVLPKNLLIDLPANRLSLQQIFKQAPAGCVAAGQSGLAKTDTCNPTGAGGFATITAVRTNAGVIIAGDVFIEKGREAVTGTVTYISYTDGYFRLNGTGSADTGVMVRLNDPDAVHTIQQGLGCAGGPNCSADPRFTLDGENYVIAFSTGYPVCIPSTVARTHPAFPAVSGVLAIAAGIGQANANGTGDILCPDSNRVPALLSEPPVADSRRFAPLVVGDSVTVEGNFETIGGVRFISTHTMRVNKALSTRNTADQPDYLFLEEVFIEAPGFQNQRIRAMWIGFTTLAPTDVDIWSIQRDPVTNAPHELPLASVRGCDLAAGAGVCGNQGLVGAGANIFRIRYDVDFLMAQAGFPQGTKDAKLSPCDQINANSSRWGLPCGTGVSTLAKNFAVLSPVPHEIQARTGHLIQNPGLANVTVDVSGHQATNGQYLFPLGMNLGGIEVAEMTEIDLNLLFTPTIFEGIPWNLDRRLGPSGCLDNNGNPAACPAGPLPLDPFPYTGLDPRAQTDFAVGGLGGGLPTGPFNIPSLTANNLTNIRNRIFSYVDAAFGKPNGDFTVLPYVLGTFPADPAALSLPAIVPITTPALACIAGGFAPVAQNDTAVTNAGIAVTIPVLFNDIAPVGLINYAGIAVSLASHGTVTANLDGTVTYLPAPGFAGTDTFTYNVPELTSGAVSNVATVTVTVIGPPVAANDSVVTNKNVPALIPVLVNDSSPSGSLIPSSVAIGSAPASGTAIVNASNGTITYTPNANFSGNDTFTYTVKDNAVPQQTSNIATVTVLINNLTTLPLAINDAVSTAPSTTVTIDLLANDQVFGATLVPGTVVISGLTPTTSGTLVSIGTGTVDFVPSGVFGPASFTYTVQDSQGLTSNVATVSIIVASPPVANPDFATILEDTPAIIDLTANDTDPDGNMLPSTAAVFSGPANGTVTNLGTGTVVYTPNLNYNGVDSFTYTVSDLQGGVSLAASVTVTITPVNDPPTAGALNFTIFEDTPQAVTLAGTDPDGDPLTYTITSSLLNGALTGIAPNLTYMPNLNYNGPAFFAYTVSDGVFTSAPASVAITVTPINDAPVTVNDAATTAFNRPVTISVLANDTDVDGTIASATVAIAALPANGTATVNTANGTITYTPNFNFSGQNTFTYTVADNLGAVSLPATVTVNVANATGTVAVSLAQFRTVTPGVSGDWRVEGTGTPGATVTIYVGGTIPGPVVGSIAIDGAGRWKFLAAGSNVLPGPTNIISVETSTGATRFAFPVAVQ